MGGDARDAGRPFELDLQEAPVQPVDASLALGQPDSSGSRRTLLAGVALPLPPSINAYWGNRVILTDKPGGGGLIIKCECASCGKTTELHRRAMALPYVTHEGKAYQEHIRQLMLDGQRWFRSPHPLEVRVLVCFKDARKQDVTNRIKVLEDALMNGNVFVDDSQVESFEIRRGPNMNPGICFVHVREILPDRTANLAWIQGGM